MPVAAVLAMCVTLAGCSMLSGSPKIHKSAKGTVYLEEVIDWTFEADHPATVDQLTIQKIVKGLYADESMNPSSKMPATGGTPMRVFSDEDAEFLAPLLAQGLLQAKPEHIVGFTLSSSTGSGAEPMAGTFYIKQGAVYVTIAPSRNVKVAGFTPNSLARVEKAPAYAAGGSIGAMSLVIDYQALAKAPMPSSMTAMAKPAGTAQSGAELAPKLAAPKQEAMASIRVVPVSTPMPVTTAQPAQNSDELLSRNLTDLQKAREANEAKANEIKLLRKELDWMKRELRERTDEIKALQTKTSTKKTSAPKKKTAEVQPTP